MVNIMNEYVSYNRKTINNYMKFILNNKYKKELIEGFTEAYLDARYNPYMDGEDLLNLNKRLNLAFQKVNNELKNERNKDQIEFLVKVYKYVNSLDQLYYLEQQKKAINEINDLRNKYFGTEDEEFVEQFNVMVREDIKKRKDFLDSFSNDIFYLDASKISKNSNCLYVKVNNKIKFPTLYSEDAILKTANKDVIKEDILLIGYNLLTVKIINELLDCNYEKIYYIEMPKSIFDKKTKMSRLLSVIDNEYIMEKLRLVVNFDCFKRYKTYILELMRSGFVFAIYLDDSFEFCSENVEYLVTFEKIFMQNDKYYNKDMLKDGKIKDRIVIVDGVM